MTCGPASPGTPRRPWSPSWPRCAPGPAAPSATPPASPCASSDAAPSPSTAPPARRRARRGGPGGSATRIALRELGRRAEFLDGQLERLDELIGPLVEALE